MATLCSILGEFISNTSGSNFFGTNCGQPWKRQNLPMSAICLWASFFHRVLYVHQQPVAQLFSVDLNSDAYEFAVDFWDQGGFQIDLLLIVRLLPLVLAFFEMNTCQIIDNSVFHCVCKNCWCKTNL